MNWLVQLTSFIIFFLIIFFIFIILCLMVIMQTLNCALLQFCIRRLMCQDRTLWLTFFYFSFNIVIIRWVKIIFWSHLLIFNLKGLSIWILLDFIIHYALNLVGTYLFYLLSYQYKRFIRIHSMLIILFLVYITWCFHFFLKLLFILRLNWSKSCLRSIIIA